MAATAAEATPPRQQAKPVGALGSSSPPLSRPPQALSRPRQALSCPPQAPPPSEGASNTLMTSELLVDQLLQLVRAETQSVVHGPAFSHAQGPTAPNPAPPLTQDPPGKYVAPSLT